MGTVYHTICPNCDYQTELSLGAGLSAINLHRNIRVLSEEEQEQLLAMEKKKEIKSFHIENMILECSRCNTLEDRTIITITGHDNKTHIFGNQCPKCGESCKLIKGTDAFHVKCPKCGEAEMEFIEIGLWD